MPRKRTLRDSAAFADCVTQLLEKGNTVRFRANGESMSPSIHDGEVIHIEPISKVQESNVQPDGVQEKQESELVHARDTARKTCQSAGLPSRERETNVESNSGLQSRASVGSQSRISGIDGTNDIETHVESRTRISGMDEVETKVESKARVSETNKIEANVGSQSRASGTNDASPPVHWREAANPSQSPALAGRLSPYKVPEHVRSGQVVLAIGPAGFKVHRVQHCDADRNLYITRGDSVQTEDSHIGLEQILGWLAKVESQGWWRRTARNLAGKIRSKLLMILKLPR